MTDNRRERYAAAMASYAAGHIHEVDGPTPQQFFPLADAAIDVADKEKARLRAELDDALADLSTERRRKDDALAAIERARALAADMRTWCSHRGIATEHVQRIDDAIDGPEGQQ